MEEDPAEESITLIFSWCYAVLFMISLYWQVFTTWKCRSSAGLSFDWVQFTFFGYVCFFIFTGRLYFSSEAAEDFENEYPDMIFPVHLSDVILGFSGVVTSLLLTLQHCIYRRDVTTKYSVLGIVLIILSWFTFFLLGGLALIPATNVSTEIFFRAVAGLFCVSVLFRYPPQISLIFRMRSTRGWSMEQVYLQILGCGFLCCQVIFDATVSTSWKLYTGSIVQICLLATVLFYSFVIIIQRYTCCNDNGFEIFQTRKQLITEQAILSDRIYYEDETPPRPKIGAHKIIEDYDPNATGRVSTAGNAYRLSRSSMDSLSFCSDSDWDQTDDEFHPI